MKQNNESIVIKMVITICSYNTNKWVISNLPFTPKDASASIILATSNVGEISDHPLDIDWDANSIVCMQCHP